MAFSIKSAASNFMSSVLSDVKNTVKSAALGAINQKLGSLGPLGKLAADFVSQTAGFGTANNRTISRAIISSNNTSSEAGDWRVSISVPEVFLTGGDILTPLRASSNYSQVHPTHTHYAFNAYENSQVDAITLTGDFYQENEKDARYWIACLHFLRTATKMFYGNSDPLGNPPVVCRLNGYGKHVLNDIPVVITNFTTDLPVDVDYIECSIDGHQNYVPTQSSITVTLQPQYARRSVAGFSLSAFANGGHINGPEGFV